MTTLNQPLRYPPNRSPELMTRRAWWLISMNVVIPGSPQILAGNRRLGRIGLIATIVLWCSVVIAFALYSLARPVFLSLATNSLIVTAVQVFAAVLALTLVLLTLDTLRLVRIVRTRADRRAWIASLAVVTMVLTAGTSAYAAYFAGAEREALSGIFANGGDLAQPIDGKYNILLLGGDAGADRTGLRPDSMSVVSVDATTGKASMIGIPRNLMNAPFAKSSPMHTAFPDGYNCGECMLNSVYTYATIINPGLYPDAKSKGSDEGIEATRDAIEGVLGIQLQYYVLIDMAGFEQLIDALGGIVLPVKERLPIGGFEDANGQPIDEIGWIEPGTQHMDGFTAIWYARARHGTSDYDRMDRQRNVQEAVLKQFDPANVLSKFEAITKAGTQIVSTDIPEPMLGLFTQLAMKAKTQDVDRLEIVPPTYDVANPDFGQIHKDVTAFLKPVAVPVP